MRDRRAVCRQKCKEEAQRVCKTSTLKLARRYGPDLWRAGSRTRARRPARVKSEVGHADARWCPQPTLPLHLLSGRSARGRDRQAQAPILRAGLRRKGLSDAENPTNAGLLSQKTVSRYGVEWSSLRRWMRHHRWAMSLMKQAHRSRTEPSTASWPRQDMPAEAFLKVLSYLSFEKLWHQI